VIAFRPVHSAVIDEQPGRANGPLKQVSLFSLGLTCASSTATLIYKSIPVPIASTIGCHSGEGENTMYRFTAPMYGVLLLLITSAPAAGTNPAGFSTTPVKNLLVLHSYHYALQWTNGIDQGFESVVSASPLRINMHVEYMDSERHMGSDYLDDLLRLYQKKYQGLQLDVVVTSDDIAFRFALSKRDQLFPGVPIVFCGVNSIDLYRQSETFRPLMTNLTGVVEAVDVEKTLQLALHFHPEASEVVVINDQTVNGQINHLILEPLVDRFSNRATFFFLDDVEIGDLLSQVSGLSENSILLLMTFNRDNANNVFSYSESIDLIAGASSRPIYGVWDFYLGRGIVGGVLTSGRYQGATAANLALRVLGGDTPDRLPIIVDSPNVLMLDYLQLKRFSIAEAAIPPDAIVINRPDSFYGRYKALIWWGGSGIFLQAAVILMLGINIRRRKRVEGILQAREVQYRRIFENIQDAYYEVTFDGRILEMSPSIERILGFTREELIGQSFMTLYESPGERAVFLEAIQDRNRLPDYDIELKNASGEMVPVSINAAIVRDDAGEPVKIVGSMRNIEERKMAEKVRQRLEKKLFKAEKMEAIGTLAGGVAHDLNNILSGIISYPELLKMKLPADDPMQIPLDTIRRSGLRAAAVVEDLLTLTRRGILIKEALSINGIVNDCIRSKAFSELKNRFPDVLFDIELSPDLPLVRGSSSHLHQAFLNLLTNGAESVGGTGIIRLTTGQQRLDAPPKGYDEVVEGDYIWLKVSDNGPGIPPEHMDRIFDPFYSKKKMGRKGTGLEMAVAWGTVMDHDGYIETESRDGSGSAFTLFFPVIPDSEEKSIESDTSRLHGSERILIVDDMEEQRVIADAILSQLGYETASVSCGEAVLEHLEENRVDLVILDMIMEPGIDGLDTYRLIHKHYPNLAVVIASGYSQTDRVKEALRLGAKAFVRKPYTITQLGTCIRSVLNGRSG
jgi:PAS domain S-box-containing protein